MLTVWGLAQYVESREIWPSNKAHLGNMLESRESWPSLMETSVVSSCRRSDTSR